MNMSLAGRRALVCGASQGIGRACAVALAAAGASVTVLARKASSLESVRSTLGDGDHHALVADLSDWTEAGRLVSEHVQRFGPLHVLVNNSGGPKAGPAIEATPEEFLAGLTPHVLGSQALAQAVVPGMRSEGYGRIINIVSTSVIMPISGLGVSNVVRGAIGNWMRILASELGPDGITVNNILPGYVGTDRLGSLMEGRAQREGTTAEAVADAWRSTIPAGRFADPSEIGSVCAFLASPAAAYVSGVNLPVDGGRLAAN
ncbi:MAG: short-chain dehydrogenase [Phycisphaerae bacterium]|nr:short-chain dehydrogenase [Phycisphaerae bacterium]HBZ96947.1 short-chain dehydrogenase [Phycisphaerales bacterium]